jgi:quercetin dioxygenase-like cupin family protein
MQHTGQFPAQEEITVRPAIVLTLALFASALLSASARSEDAVVQVLPDAVKWRTYPLADGVQVSALYGGADKEGIYTLRVKMAPDAKLKIHTHPDTRMITVLSGKLYAGRGTEFDSTNETVVPAGGFFTVPAGVAHYTRAGDGEVIYQENGYGPSPTNLLTE